MNFDELKKAEIFVILAALFFLLVIFIERLRMEETPLFIFSELQGYTFTKGSAELSSSFKKFLEEHIVKEIEKKLQYNKYNTIEIIGHTDCSSYEYNVYSNLDEKLINEFNQKFFLPANLKPGSNLDLGMLRALSIARIFFEAKKKGKLKKIEFILPYSAGQIIDTLNKLRKINSSKLDSASRRIELKLIKLPQLTQTIVESNISNPDSNDVNLPKTNDSKFVKEKLPIVSGTIYNTVVDKQLKSQTTTSKKKIKRCNIHINDIYYTVQKGNSLAEISRIFNIKISKIIEWNEMKNNMVKAGQTILIKNSMFIKKNYTTKTLEKLSNISKKFDISEYNIKFFNGLQKNILAPKTKLLLYIKPYFEYVIRKDDRLEIISKKFHTPISNIKLLNNLKDSFIEEGKKLLIPKKKSQTFLESGIPQTDNQYYKKNLPLYKNISLYKNTIIYEDTQNYQNIILLTQPIEKVKSYSFSENWSFIQIILWVAKRYKDEKYVNDIGNNRIKIEKKVKARLKPSTVKNTNIGLIEKGFSFKKISVKDDKVYGKWYQIEISGYIKKNE